MHSDTEDEGGLQQYVGVSDGAPTTVAALRECVLNQDLATKLQNVTDQRVMFATYEMRVARALPTSLGVLGTVLGAVFLFLALSKAEVSSSGAVTVSYTRLVIQKSIWGTLTGMGMLAITHSSLPCQHSTLSWVLMVITSATWTPAVLLSMYYMDFTDFTDWRVIGISHCFNCVPATLVWSFAVWLSPSSWPTVVCSNSPKAGSIVQLAQLDEEPQIVGGSVAAAGPLLLPTSTQSADVFSADALIAVDRPAPSDAGEQREDACLYRSVRRQAQMGIMLSWMWVCMFISLEEFTQAILDKQGTDLGDLIAHYLMFQAMNQVWSVLITRLAHLIDEGKVGSISLLVLVEIIISFFYYTYVRVLFETLPRGVMGWIQFAALLALHFICEWVLYPFRVSDRYILYWADASSSISGCAPHWLAAMFETVRNLLRSSGGTVHEARCHSAVVVGLRTGTMLLASLNSLFQACYMLYAWNKEAFEPPVIKQDLPRAFVFVISALVTELCNVFVMQHFVYRKWQTNVWWALRILDGFSSFSWCVLVVLIVLAFNVQQPYMVMNFGIHS